MALFKPAPPASTEVNMIYRHYRHLICSNCSPLMRVRRRYRNLESQPEDRFGSSNSIDHQPQSFGDFAHGHYTAAVHQVNLPFSYYHYRSKGTSLPHQLETRSHTTCERLIVHSQTGRGSTSCVFCFPYTYTMSTRKERHSPQSSYRRQWNPCHMDYGLVPASH